MNSWTLFDTCINNLSKATELDFKVEGIYIYQCVWHLDKYNVAI